jgi:hypothetical protein
MSTTRITISSFLVAAMSVYACVLLTETPAQAQQIIAATKSQVTKEEGRCPDKASPEVEDLLNQGAFVRPLAEFIGDVRKLISIDKYDLKERVSIEIDLINSNDGRNGIQQQSSGNEWLSVAAKNAAEQITSAFGEAFYRYDDEWKQPAAHFAFTFLFENSSLIIKAKAEHSSPEQAQKLAATYNSYFSLGSCRERGEPDEVLYQNTKALVENNQVLIVTRLPRAGLLELLAKQPAAN